MAGKRKTLCIDEKVLLIRAIAKGERKSDVGRRFGFSPSTVSTIWKNKEKFLQAEIDGKSCKKLKKPKFKDLDQAMLSWFREQRQKNMPVSGPILKAKAEKIAVELSITEFKASEGWLGKFKQRHHINYGKVSGEARDVDTNKINVKSLDDNTVGAAQPCGSQSNRNVVLAGPSTESFKSVTQEIEKTQVTSDTDDKYDVLGKYVASKVRQLDIQQRMYVERIIHEAIYEGQMGHLNNNSLLVVNTETFISSQSHDRKRLGLEIAEQQEDDPEIPIEFDMEEVSENKDLLKEKLLNFSSVSHEDELMHFQEPKEIQQLDFEDAPEIKIEIVTEEDEEFQENLSTDYYVTNTQTVTTKASESPHPDHDERNRLLQEGYLETHSKLQDSNVNADIKADPLDDV